jgi:hypothetical protein
LKSCQSIPIGRIADRAVPYFRSFYPQSGTIVAWPVAGFCHFRSRVAVRRLLMVGLYLLVDSMPCDHDIASATWTWRAVAELIAKRVGVDLTFISCTQRNRKLTNRLR